MTILNTICRNPYVGTNSQSVYPYTFLLFQAADLIVQTQATTTSLPITLVLNVDYTITGIGSYSGGNVVLTAGNLPTGVVLSIFRNPAQVQFLLLQEQTAYNAQAVMGALDDLTMQVLAVQDQVSRAIVRDPLDPTTPISGTPGPPWPSSILPPMASMLGQYVYCDPTTGQFIGLGGPGPGTGGYLLIASVALQTVSGPVTFSGALNAVTQAANNNTTLVATTAFVLSQIASSLIGYLTVATATATYLPITTAAATYNPIANSFKAFFTATATQNITVPAGVTSVEIELWGGGASGQGDVGTAGGGGAAYIHTVIAVTPGDVLNFVVGTGGASSTTSSQNNGAATTFAKNGGAAIFTAGGGTGAAGGTASGTGQFFSITGQRGGLGVGAGAISGFVVAGTGGDCPRGGPGGPGGLAGAASGYPGVAPGGGGSSAFPGAGQASGAGAAGAWTLRY